MSSHPYNMFCNIPNAEESRATVYRDRGIYDGETIENIKFTGLDMEWTQALIESQIARHDASRMGLATTLLHPFSLEQC